MAYYEQRTLNRHMKYAHSTALRKRYRCPNTLCDKSYSSISSFKMHACVDGRRPQKFLNTICSMCSKRFFNKFELNRHIKRTHVSKPENFKCNECNKTFIYRYWDSFVLHVAQKCAKIIKYQCEYCSKVVPSKTKLIEHFVDNHDIVSITKAQPCPHCSKLFFNKNSLKYHLKKNHIDLKCDHCYKTFLSKAGYSLHQKKCIPKKTFDKYSKGITGFDRETAAHECHICKCSFIKKTNLLEHMTEVHLKKNFQFQLKKAPISQNICSMCDQSFTNRFSLSKHKIRMHKNKRNFKCQKCNVKFTGEKIFRNHLKKSECIKKQIQQYQCIVCSKIYARNAYLKRHLKQMHSSKSEYFACDVCNRSFNSKRSLLRHFQNRDHRTTFQCEFCLRIFKRISGYKTHMNFCKSNRKKKLLTKV